MSVRMLGRVTMHLQTAFVQCGSMHDVPRDDHSALSLRASLDCICGDTKQIAAKVVHGKNAAHESIRHGNRFDYRQVPAHSYGLPDQVGYPFQHDQYLASFASLANHENNKADRAFALLTSAETPRAATSTVPLDLMGAAPC
jgi:hypothetical protein